MQVWTITMMSSIKRQAAKGFGLLLKFFFVKKTRLWAKITKRPKLNMQLNNATSTITNLKHVNCSSPNQHCTLGLYNTQAAAGCPLRRQRFTSFMFQGTINAPKLAWDCLSTWKVLISASQQCLEAGWKLYCGNRPEEREQAAMHHLESPQLKLLHQDWEKKAERSILSFTYITRWVLETRSTVNMEEQDLIFLKRSKKMLIHLNFSAM